MAPVRDRSSYYRAIQSVRERGLDLTEWLEYFTIGLGSQLAEDQEKGESLIRLDVLTSKHQLTARQRVALEPAANMPEFRMEDFEARCPDIHRRSLQGDLRALIEEYLVVAEGATNRRIYRMAGKP